jgi:hypothetical protein
MRSLAAPAVLALAALALPAAPRPVDARAARPAHGQGAQTADEIVARHLQARGGHDRIRAIQTLKITRTVVTQFSEVEVVILKKRPHSFRVEQQAPGQPPIFRVVTADGVWDLAGGKLTNRAPAAAAEARDLDGDFDGPLVDWKQKGHAIELAGREPLPGGDAFKIQVTTKNGVARTFFIDASTYLVRRITGITILPGDRKANLETDILGYKDAGGVKFPADIQEDRTGAGPVQTTVTYTKAIEINVPIDDALFAPPAPATPIPGRFGAADASPPRASGDAPADRRW